ncbi:hypothetical protein UNSW3_696 [Campylobacter concisus UNSW3]|uniref:Uncharacterized protein n=1 Tax=Campylobacter concisus UNSW3 TaxID=1242966 RepID=U2F1M7_9BACT|nr:hypothetical protein UNSW3_696 [Campylobacter concisus UNSW3]
MLLIIFSDGTNSGFCSCFSNFNSLTFIIFRYVDSVKSFNVCEIFFIPKASSLKLLEVA